MTNDVSLGEPLLKALHCRGYLRNYQEKKAECDHFSELKQQVTMVLSKVEPI